MGLRAFSTALKANTALLELILSNSPLGLQGARMLGDILTANSSLQTLCVEHCKLRDAGATHLADALKENSTLTCLNVRNNEISSTGAAAFLETLSVNFTLTQLWLNEVPESQWGNVQMSDEPVMASPSPELLLQIDQLLEQNKEERLVFSLQAVEVNGQVTINLRHLSGEPARTRGGKEALVL